MGLDLGQLTPLQNLALGTFSGVGCKLTNYPLLVWKNATQQGLPLSMNPSVVYRGLPMACMNLGGTTAVQFWFTGFFQKMILAGQKRPLKSDEEIKAAFMAGLVGGIPCAIWELTMIQQQRYGGSIISAPKKVIAENGIKGLTRGMVPCMGREALFTMGMLGLSPVLQKKFADDFNMEPNSALAAGALLSSLFAATLSHPLDTIKTCQQGDANGVKYGSIKGTASTLVAEYGAAQGLFKGLAWRTVLITTTFFLVNKIKQGVAPLMFPQVVTAPEAAP